MDALAPQQPARGQCFTHCSHCPGCVWTPHPGSTFLLVACPPPQGCSSFSEKIPCFCSPSHTGRALMNMHQRLVISLHPASAPHPPPIPHPFYPHPHRSPCVPRAPLPPPNTQVGPPGAAHCPPGGVPGPYARSDQPAPGQRCVPGVVRRGRAGGRHPGPPKEGRRGCGEVQAGMVWGDATCALAVVFTSLYGWHLRLASTPLPLLGRALLWVSPQLPHLPRLATAPLRPHPPT